MSKKETQGGLRELLRVMPGEKLDLTGFDYGSTFGRDKDAAQVELTDNLARLTGLHDRLWAEAKHAVLIVLQGIDAAGKDGTIKVIAGGVNNGSPECPAIFSRCSM